MNPDEILKGGGGMTYADLIKYLLDEVRRLERELEAARQKTAADDTAPAANLTRPN